MKLDANIEEYLERYETLMGNKDDTVARAEHAAVQEIKSTAEKNTKGNRLYG